MSVESWQIRHALLSAEGLLKAVQRIRFIVKNASQNGSEVDWHSAHKGLYEHMGIANNQMAPALDLATRSATGPIELGGVIAPTAFHVVQTLAEATCRQLRVEGGIVHAGEPGTEQVAEWVYVEDLIRLPGDLIRGNTSDPDALEPIDDTDERRLLALLQIEAARIEERISQPWSEPEWSRPVAQKDLRHKLNISQDTLRSRLLDGSVPASGKYRCRREKLTSRKIEVAIDDMPESLHDWLRKTPLI